MSSSKRPRFEQDASSSEEAAGGYMRFIPDDIILNILQRLPTKDLAAVRVVSTQCKRVVATIRKPSFYSCVSYTELCHREGRWNFTPYEENILICSGGNMLVFRTGNVVVVKDLTGKTVVRILLQDEDWLHMQYMGVKGDSLTAGFMLLIMSSIYSGNLTLQMYDGQRWNQKRLRLVNETYIGRDLPYLHVFSGLLHGDHHYFLTFDGSTKRFLVRSIPLDADTETLSYMATYHREELEDFEVALPVSGREKKDNEKYASELKADQWSYNPKLVHNGKDMLLVSWELRGDWKREGDDHLRLAVYTVHKGGLSFLTEMSQELVQSGMAFRYGGDVNTTFTVSASRDYLVISFHRALLTITYEFATQRWKQLAFCTEFEGMVNFPVKYVIQRDLVTGMAL